MATGAVFYIDAVGNKMTREEYLERYNIDPEVAYQNMRSKAAKPFSKLEDGECQSKDAPRTGGRDTNMATRGSATPTKRAIPGAAKRPTTKRELRAPQ